MTPQQLVEEARAAGERARHNLKWIQRHPERIDEAKRADAEEYLNRMIRFAEEERKSARRAGRTHGGLRSHLKHLIALIIPHLAPQEKEGGRL